jgi:hypothetical protein
LGPSHNRAKSRSAWPHPAPEVSAAPRRGRTDEAGLIRDSDPLPGAARMTWVAARTPIKPRPTRCVLFSFWQAGTVHPPPFRPEHRFSDWPDCSLELHCCKGVVLLPLRLLLMKRGDRTFEAALSAMRCDRCGGKPAPAYLCAGHRRQVGGPPLHS